MTWQAYRLGDVVDVLDSRRVPVNEKERQKRAGSVPYYGATGQVGWIDQWLFEEELVLVGEDGAPFLDRLKQKAYLIRGKSWVNNHAHVLRAKGGFATNSFIKHYLDSFDYTEYVNGTTRLKLTQGSMRDIPILLPEVDEQRRIADKLDLIAARFDDAKARLDTIPTILKRFRMSVLAAACSGRLTEHWRRNRGYVELEGFGPVPSNWPQTRLGDLLEPDRSVCYGVIKLGPECANGVPCLRTSDVKPLSIDPDSVKRISRHIADQYRRTYLRGGELLVNVRGTLGGVAVVPTNMSGWNVSREVAVVPVDKQRLLPEFACYWVASSNAQAWLTEVAKGVAYTGINLSDLRLLPTAIPNITEQVEIVRRVDALFKQADGIEARYRKAQAFTDKLMPAVLAKAFRGELVEANKGEASHG